jgi:hypothetical protein
MDVHRVLHGFGTAGHPSPLQCAVLKLHLPKQQGSTRLGVRVCATVAAPADTAMIESVEQKATPKPIFRKDYKPPPYLIDKVGSVFTFFYRAGPEGDLQWPMLGGVLVRSLLRSVAGKRVVF